MLLLLDFLGLGLGQFLGGFVEAWSAVFSLCLLRLVVLQGAEQLDLLSLLAALAGLALGLEQEDCFPRFLYKKAKLQETRIAKITGNTDSEYLRDM